MSGWIKIHRQITEWEWYRDANTFRVFMHLLLSANYEDKRWRNIDVLRGQIITGRVELAQALCLSERQVRTSLEKLKMSGVISIKTTNQYCHFPKYDSEYFKQLTAEQLVTKMVRGYQKREWQKTRERNEALDCRVYARAASISFGIEQFTETKWRNLEKALIPESKEKVKLPAKKKPKLDILPKIVKAQDPYL